MAKPHFRAGVVTVVQRLDGCVLAFSRVDVPDQWQLPQGGIEPGETPRRAAWRELREETGLGRGQVRLVDEYDGWTAYAWPSSMQSSPRIGQAHRWFFFEPLLDDVVPEPDGSEFDGWRWMSVDELIANVVDFRRGPYLQVLRAGRG
jgi:putative (di)nucleoside polyphosphate hydrolase